MFDPITLLAGLIPIVTEAGKAAVQRWIAPDQIKPVTVADYIALKTADIDLFKAINDAGGGNPSYLWVEAVIRLQRPIVAIIVLSVWAATHLNSVISDTSTVDNMASAIGFYLFADRTLFYARKATK